jgi:hypothetical protein
MPPKLAPAGAHPCACTRNVPNAIPAAAMPTRIERIKIWWSSMANDSKKRRPAEPGDQKQPREEPGAKTICIETHSRSAGQARAVPAR